MRRLVRGAPPESEEECRHMDERVVGLVTLPSVLAKVAAQHMGEPQVQGDRLNSIHNSRNAHFLVHSRYHHRKVGVSLRRARALLQGCTRGESAHRDVALNVHP
eukprot:scaffold6021_cov379-Prasinococcus_capsulatus_cf.AAC.4